VQPTVRHEEVGVIGIDTVTDIAKVVEDTRDYYDGPADEIYRRLWRDNIHMGTWSGTGDTIDAAMARTNEVMVERGGLEAGSEVLDLGSGYGAAARYLAGQHGCWVVGVNISPRENELAVERNRDAGLDERIDIRYGDFHDLPFDEASFDAVWSQEALLHAADKPRVLAECKRVLRPGGRLVLSDLLVRASLGDEERRRIYERVRSPVMWDLGEYAAAIGEVGLELVLAEDWPQNVAPTYQSVLDQLVEQRDALADVVPTEQVERTIAALQLWIDSARAGRISHGFLVARRAS